MIAYFAELSDQTFEYLSSVYQNSLIELAIFVTLASLWFF